ALDERARAPVLALPLQQIEGEEDHRRLREDLRPGVLAVEALLQRRERHHAAILPREDLAVDHAARQARRIGHELGKLSRDGLVAARPERRHLAAADE